MAERNALAELAGILKHHIEPRRLNADKDEFAVAICKAQRIIAELAKVGIMTYSGLRSAYINDTYKAFMDCLAIAEEGDGDATVG